jgi:hypothetical protein
VRKLSPSAIRVQIASAVAWVNLLGLPAIS